MEIHTITVQEKAVKVRENIGRYGLVIIILCLLCLVFQSHGGLMAQETIAEGEVSVKGLSLTVDPAEQTVPINTATTVNTVFSMETQQLLKGMVVKGELRGPGLSKAITLTTLPGHPFSIPAISVQGDYYLENIRLERDGDVLMKAVPESVLLRIIDIVVTRVETRPLTLDEIREKGINITDENFTVFNFSVGILVESTEVQYNFPVVYSNKGPYIPATSGMSSSSSGSGGAGFGRQRVAFELQRLEVDEEANETGEVGDSNSAKMTGILVFNNDIAFLNQFFSVMFIVANNAPEGSELTLKDMTATITYPDGLREAETSPPHISGTPIPVRCPGPDGEIDTSDDVDIILAAFSGMAEFLAEGLKEGTHIVTIDFNGTLTGLPSGDVPVEGSASGAVIVRNPEFSITFAHPEVIRVGEEYDIHVTMTNTSSVTANLTSLTMPATRLIGTQLLSDESVSYEKLEPGESETATFHMLSMTTGKVRASAFEADGNVSGKFVLTAGVGEEDIPLSPDTLVLPSYAYALPDTVINAAVVSLGEAYSIAVTPPTGLPAHLPKVDEDVVETRIVELAEAGQRVKYGEAALKSIQVLALDWLGNRYPDLPFDTLRRMTSKGIKLSAAEAELFNEELAAVTAADFQESFAETCSYKNPFISAVLSFSGGARSARLIITDYYGNRLTYEDDEMVRDIPYSDLYLLEDAVQSPIDFALVGRLAETGYTYAFEVMGEASGSFDLSLIVPFTGNVFKQVTFTGIACEPDSRSYLTYNMGDETFTLATDLDGDLIADSQIAGTVQAIVEPPLQLLNAMQDCSVDSAGHVAALLFNRSLTNNSETLKNYFYPELQTEHYFKDHFNVGEKVVYAAFLQPSERVVLLGLDNPISPFVQSTVRVDDMLDTKGYPMQPSSMEMPIQATITTPGGVVYGRVLTASGKPVINARVRLDETENSGGVTHSFTRTDTSGNYQFDFVRILTRSFDIVVTDLSTGKSEKITSRLRVNGQRLNLDIYMRGRGTVTGRVFNQAGEPFGGAIIYASAENAGNYEYFTARCDENGNFSITDVPLGAVNVRASYGNLKGVADTVVSYDGEICSVSVTIMDAITGTVNGRILKNDGVTPVENAVFYIYRNGRPMNYVEISDEDGFFQFDNVSIGTFTIYCSMGPSVSGEIVEGQTFSAVFILRGTGTITGSVKAYDGTLLSGIPVFIRNQNFSMNTDSNGEFHFEDVPVGSHSIVAYNSSTYEDISVNVLLNVEGQEVRTTLTFPAPPQYGGISGTLYDVDGSVMPNKQIWVFDDKVNFVSFAETNESGYFQIDGLNLGMYLLGFQEAGKAGVANAGLIHASQLVTADIHLIGTGDIHVNVYGSDGVSGVMADVTVMYRSFEFNPGSRIGFITSTDHLVTDENGYLEMNSVYLGPYMVEAKNAFYPEGASQTGTIDTLGQVEAVALVMVPTGKVNVTVVNYDNTTPIDGAALRFQAGSLPLQENIYTGTDGQFLFTLVPPGGFSIEAEDPVSGLKGQISGSMGRDGQQVEVHLRLKGTGTVTVTVKDQQDNVIPNAKVTLRNITYPHEINKDKVCDENGSYTFQGVFEGDFSIEAFDLVSGRGGRANGTVAAHNEQVNVDLVLESTGSVLGQVFQPDNETLVPGARVVLYIDGVEAPFGYVTSDTDGAFRFDYVPVGSFRVEVLEPLTSRQGKSSGTVVGEGDEIVVNVSLEGRGSVAGTFYDGSMVTPVANAEVYIESDGRFPFQRATSTDDQGNFYFEEIGVGDFTLKAKEPSSNLWGNTVGSVEYDGQEIFINIYAKGAGIVEGKVYEADGTTTVSGAFVELEGTEKTAYSDAAGNYRVEYVPIGNYTLTASENPGRDKGSASGQILYHGQETAMDILFEGLGTVSGTVKDGSGNPLADINVKLRSGGETFTVATHNGTSGTVGTFTFQEIHLGTFTLNAGDPVSGLGASADGAITSAGQEVILDLTFDTVGTVGGTVFAADGTTPAENAYITLKGSGFTLYTLTDANGEFEYDNVKLGSFTMEIQGGGNIGKAKRSGELTSSTTTIDFNNIVLDDQIPLATSISPGDGSVHVAVDTQIVITFSEAMDMTTITTDTLKLMVNGQIVAYTKIEENDTTLRLTPVSNLSSFALYVITIDASVTDPSGNALGSDVTATFTTLDLVPPQVIAVEPADGANEISLLPVITVTFNEPVDTSQIGTSNITLAQGGTPVSGTVTFGANSISLLFTPSQELTSDSTYTVSVQGIPDMAGNVLAQPFGSSFNTLDTTAPTLQLNPPAAGTTVIEGTLVTVNADTGSAADVAVVYFFINGELTFTDTAAPYDYEFTAPLISQVGTSFLLEAYVVDTAGNQGTRENLQFTLLTDQPPQISMTTPAETTVFPGTAVTVPVTASDDIEIKTVAFNAAGGAFDYSDSIQVNQTSFSHNYNFQVPGDIQPGTTISISAEAVDSRDQQSTAPGIYLQVPDDQQVPTVNLMSPQDEQRFEYNETIEIAAVASDDVGLKELRFYKDDQLLAVDNSSPYETTYIVPALETDETVTIKVEAEDLIGQVSQDTVTVTLGRLIDVQAPVVTLLSPTNGMLVFPGENLKIAVTATDDSANGVDRVEFYLDDQLINTVTEEPYETVYTIPTDAVTGTNYAIKVQAVDIDNKSNYVLTSVSVVEGTLITGGTVIGATDTQYDGLTVIIKEGTVTIDGNHMFENVLVKESGQLNHTGASTTDEYKMELSVTGKVVVGIDAVIDAKEKGYLGGLRGGNTTHYGYTIGNTVTGGSYQFSGGGYGGYGGQYSSNAVNEVYGSIYDPKNPGSGGGGYLSNDRGGNGGGVIRIAASQVIVDGRLDADGGQSPYYSGSGSGGSIRLDVTLLKGTGEIHADGGDCPDRGAGGGGRIAVYYESIAGFDMSKITARGGLYTNGSIAKQNGGAGTIYLEKSGETGRIIIDNNGTETIKGTPITTVQSQTSTGLTDTVLTNDNADFASGTLMGMLLQPNVNNPKTFVIVANDQHTITVEIETGDGMLNYAQAGDKYQVKYGAELLLEDARTHFSGSVSTSALTLVNTTLTMDGTLTVDGLLSLQSGSRLTHSTTTSSIIYSLSIAAGEIAIDSSSTVDVSDCGYLGGLRGDNSDTKGRTLGNTITGGSYQFNGGGYGGYGGMYTNSQINGIYGSIYQPADPGSGGGGYLSSDAGGNGGGILRIVTSELVLDGEINSNGGMSPLYGGGGSGGSIWINADTISGSGAIHADGGNCVDRGAGGGGRIALYYNDASGFNLSSITAYGGTYTNGTNAKRNGGAGTIYLEKNEEEGVLTVNNRGQDCYKALLFPAVEPAVVDSVSGNQLVGQNVNYMPNSLAGMKLIPNIDSPENIYTIVSNTADSITVDLPLTGVSAGDTYKGIFVVDGHLKIINTKSEIDGDLEVTDLSITGNGALSHPLSTTAYAPYLYITAANRVYVETGSSIDVSGKGYLGGLQPGNDNLTLNPDKLGRTLGNTLTGGSQLFCGGSYGGIGGIYGSRYANDVYGSIYDPCDPGSGGGGYISTDPGGNGGGVLHIAAVELELDGNIYAAGGMSATYGGGGSGGAIRLDVTTLTGTGEIHADGADCIDRGAGGGGRIAVYYNDVSQFDTTNITAYGGVRTNGAVENQHGGAGTVFLKQNTATYGDLIVNNNSIISRTDSTPLPAVGQGYNTTLATNNMENTAAAFAPGALTGIKLNPNPTGSNVFTIISNTQTIIYTDPSEGNLTDYGTQGGAYIGEHYLINLTVKGYAKVSTTDRIQVSGTMIVESGSTLSAENIQ